MLKKTVMVAIATLAIAAGSLSGIETASAAGMMMHDGPMGHRHKVCKPVFKQIKIHRGDHVFFKKVKVGEKCVWVR